MVPCRNRALRSYETRYRGWFLVRFSILNDSPESLEGIGRYVDELPCSTESIWPMLNITIHNVNAEDSGAYAVDIEATLGRCEY